MAECDNGRIMDLQPEALHQRVPFYVGSTHLVQAFRSCQHAVEEGVE
jgi:fructose-1,6-bisphosphatase